MNTTMLLLIMVVLLAVLVLSVFGMYFFMVKKLKQSQKASQDTSYISQKLPEWIKQGIAETLKPELDRQRRVFENYAETVGDSQVEVLEEIINRFVEELNKKVEESASQYAMRIAQSAEQFNKSLADINSTVSVTLTDALGGFDNELQATLVELLGTMKKLRSVTNNIPKVIDVSFSEMQRSFDEMEEEMHHTIVAFRDMRVKIEAQQKVLGPVKPKMLRAEAVPQMIHPSTTKKPDITEEEEAENSQAITPAQNEGAKSASKKIAKASGGIDFSNY